MAAYAAAISLKHTIHRFLNSNSNLPVVSSSREIVEFADEELTSVQQVLKRLDDIRSSSSRSVLQALDGQIRDAVYRLEDVIESHTVIAASQSEEKELISFEDVREEINSLIEEVREMKEQYVNESDNPSPDREEGAVLSSVDFDGMKYVNVGLPDCFLRDITDVLTQWMPYEFGVVSIVGTGGTGASMVARAAFNHRYNVRSFDSRAWVTVGPRYDVKQILICLLSQIDPRGDGGDDDKLVERVYASLKGRKYLVALDNVCDAWVWDYLRSSFPPENNGSRVLLTTSREDVAEFANSFRTYHSDALDEEESWDLIRELVFDGEESCPPELEEAGKMIARNCDGLCLEIIKAVFLLSDAEKTPEHWNKIAAEKRICIFKDAYDEMSLISQITEHLQLMDNMLHHYDGNVSSRTYFAKVIETVLVPRYMIVRILEDLFQHNLRQRPTMLSLLGMAGIGKTTLAKKIFEDPSTLHHFDHRAWVTLGPKYQYERLLVDILAQMDPDVAKLSAQGDEILAKHFCSSLSTKRCLIVLDDVWDKKPLSYLDKLFKDIKIKVLVTTRLKEIAHFSAIEYVTEMRLLDKEESWCLLRENVFGENSCPAELERPGRIIAEMCEGLPLMIVTVASLLSQAEKTLEFWNKVAGKKNSVFEHAYDEISSILLPSYDYLPQHLKSSFLYLGVFPQKYEIPTSKLFELWSSEEILESNFSKYLKELVSRSLLMTPKKNYRVKIKTCRLHSAFWHLCIREARNNKFFLVINSNLDDLAESVDGQRRLCIHNNILFAIKDVYTLMASNSTVRSLLCTGRHHQYPVPVCSSFTLLRILDALTIRFYEFPAEVIEQVQLRYLSLTCNGKLPASISKLWNLRYLIVGRHLCSKLYGASTYLPKEIWGMKQLKHLQVMGRDLPDPCGAVLPDLAILLDVSPRSCTKCVLQGTPNLQKLGIRIELGPDASESSFCFDHISHLHRLESLKCVVVNPEFRSELLLPPAPMFPSGLKKLSLSGLGYPWKYMNIISELKNLEVLKLRCYAFRGPEWVMHPLEIYKLKYLLIEDTDLVYWRYGAGSGIHCLSHLIIRHCYKLQEIPKSIADSFCLSKCELVDCHPSAWKQLARSLLRMRRPSVHSSWE